MFTSIRDTFLYIVNLILGYVFLSMYINILVRWRIVMNSDINADI